ncbi:hypothetical protein SRABI106_04690 [Rahnella aquatilis]|nr:hypothetical protein SRABI106_04690 [Rahnella aquatilis]
MRTTAIASMALNKLGPSAAASAMVNTSDGTDSMMSIQRIISASTTPPTTPEKQPSNEPVVPAMITTASPAATDCWLPISTRLNRSRPTSSVPNQCSAEGACKRSVRLMAFGSCGTSHGEKIMMKSTISMIASPNIVSGLRLSK